MSNEHITDERLQAEQFEHLLTIGLRDELRPAIPAVMWLFRAWLESADLRPAAQPVGEPVASIYISPNGDREFDDWKCALPVGSNILYTTPQPVAVPDRVPMTDEQRAEVFRKAEARMVYDSNLSWRNAVVEETEAHHRIATPKADK